MQLLFLSLGLFLGLAFGQDTCLDPLGMEDGGITDKQIRASSSFSQNYGPQNGRLNNEWCWSAKSLSGGAWFSVDLLEPHTVRGLIIQGCGKLEEWVTSFTLAFSNDGRAWSNVNAVNSVTPQVFRGAEDQNTPVKINFDIPISTRYLKINVVSYEAWPGLRVEFIGCTGEQDEACDSDPCMNGGVCVSGGDGTYKCQCVPGLQYIGDNCELKPGIPDTQCSNFVPGDISGAGSEETFEAGDVSKYDCIRICVDEREQNDKINGVTVQVNGGQCYCEISGSSIIPYEGYETCFLPDLNACNPSPCLNGASCELSGDDSFKCSCSEGWLGDTCSQDLDECLKNPCLNGGNCINTVGSFKCDCTKGFTGQTCSENICLPSPCENGGTCIGGDDNTFTCYCSDGWTGTTCSEDVNECTTNPCLNAAECVNLDGSFRCKCAEGLVGQLCSTDICSPSPCQNEGVCSAITDDTFKCACLDGWIGDTCKQDHRACLPSPCKNGGICTALTKDTFTCACVDGWSGDTCSQGIACSFR